MAPWYLQAVALPVGLVVLVAFRDWVPLGRPGGMGGLRWLWRSVHVKGALSLHYVGFLRFFVKFSLLSYLPLLLVFSRGKTAAEVGLILGVSSLCGTLGAAVSGLLARLGPASRWVINRNWWRERERPERFGLQSEPSIRPKSIKTLPREERGRCWWAPRSPGCLPAWWAPVGGWERWLSG